MISVLCPSYGRPELLQRMIDSMESTCWSGKRYDLYVYVNDDDPKREEYQSIKGIEQLLIGDAKSVGVAWNKLAEICRGSILMMGNDDHVYVTQDWDEQICRRIAQKRWPDDIYVAWVNDGSRHAPIRCAFPIVSKKWYKTLGYFTPECFHFLYHDTWVWDIGKTIGRTAYFDDILVEHRHFTNGGQMDDTYRKNRTGAHKRDREIFIQTEKDRQEDAEKLKVCMTKTTIIEKV